MPSNASKISSFIPGGTVGLPLVGLVALVVSGCASSTPPPAPEARIHGRVVGHTGQALDGVRITTTPATDAVLTLEGKYELKRQVKTKAPISPGIYTIVAYKLGWSTAKTSSDLRIEYPGGDFKVRDIQLLPIIGPTMDDVGAPADRTPDRESQGSGVVRDGE